MNHIRHTATVIAGLLVSVVGLFVAAPAAFAMRLGPPSDGSGPVATAFATSSGMAGWEITLIAVSAALFAATATAVVLRGRFRATVRPAAA